MKSFQKRNYGYSKSAFLFSIILHGFAAALFIIIDIEIPNRKSPDYFIINLSANSENKTEAGKKNKKTIQKHKFSQTEKNNFKETLPVQKESALADNDTTGKKSSFSSSVSDSAQDDLTFARSLLDTFLVRHPEYSSLILKERAKDLKDKKFYRETLEKKLNDEIHKYLRSKFPEGSEHAVNKYAGPGLQIPIGDLIDLVKKIFK